MSEYILYYTFQDITGAEQLSEKYASINPMAKYLRDEFLRIGVTQNEIRELFPSRTGGLTGCVTNWIKGYNFPLKLQYETIRKYLKDVYNEDLRREYEDLRREYEDLRREYEDLRYSFNFVEPDITRTWLIPPSPKKGHLTPKPISLMNRIILHSSKEGAIVLDPFLGSGTTLRACRETDRVGLGFEINKDYEEVIRKRAQLDIPRLEVFG